MNQSIPGKAGSNSCMETRYLKNLYRIDGDRWSSSGKISQDSLHWEFSTIFERWWLNQSLNQSNSKEGSSSCQCTMTLVGQNEEKKKIELRKLSELPSITEDSRKDVGRFWDLDPRRNGTDPIPKNRMENGIKLLKTWCSTLPKADILFRVSSALESGEQRKRKENLHFNGSDEILEVDSSHNYFCQSAISSVLTEQ